MSVETERSSTESSAASGLDFEDTALTLRLPGSSSSCSSDPDRKRASTDPDSRSPRAAASDSPPSPGPGCGVAAGAIVPEERARGGGGVQGQVRQGGRRRRAVPAQGGPGGVRGLRQAPCRAPGQVLLPLHRPQGWERRDGARGRGERDGVRADVRGQGRGLDARRRRPLENVCGDLPASSSHEKL